MIGDNYSNEDSAYNEGYKELTVEKLEFVKSTGKGTEGIKVYFLYGDKHEFKINKTFWESKVFNRFWTSFITDLGLDAKELDEAAKRRQFNEWIMRKLPGRHGTFYCEKGDPNAEGKRYLQVMTKAEIDLNEYNKTKNNTAPNAPEPSPSSSPDGTPPDFPDDIPF